MSEVTMSGGRGALPDGADPLIREAVWFNMLFGDIRDRWDGDGVTDPRVRHFWDEQKLVGNWYSADVLHRPGTTWDFYALYGPDATWGAEPPWASSEDQVVAALVRNHALGGTI